MSNAGLRAFSLVNTEAILGANAQFQSTVTPVAPSTGGSNRSFTAILGRVIADVAGTLEIWQSDNTADLTGLTAGAGAHVVSIAVPAGGNGTEIAEAIVAGNIRFSYVNGVGGQATFRLSARAVQ